MNRYLYAFLLLECINFFGFNCQRKIDELYRGYYGPIIQCIFGIGAMLATICSYAFTIGLFFLGDFTWYSPIIIYLAVVFIPLGNGLWMIATIHERSWIGMFVMQIISLVGVLVTTGFMIAFFVR